MTQTPTGRTPSAQDSKPDAMQDALRRAGAVNGEQPGDIAADDAGATTLAEKVARNAEPRQIDEGEKADIAAETSRQTDA